MNENQIATMPSLALKQTRDVNRDNGVKTTPQFFCEQNWYEMADILRSQFESQVLSARESNDGLTPFTYAFCESAYQFLTASAERIFTPEILEDLIQRIRSWAETTVETGRVSTPQIRVFVSGCRRHLLQDDIASPWRYALSLTRPASRRAIGSMTIVTEDPPRNAREAMRIEPVLSSRIEFNQLLVHRTKHAYSIEVTGKSMNPSEGAVLLDGYLW